MGLKGCRKADSNRQKRDLGEIACACSLMRCDPARPPGPARGLCVAQGADLDHPRPDRNFRRSAGMRRRRCLIFSFDLMIVGSELQNAILAKLQQLGFGPDEIVLLASHTHNSPATDQACARLGVPEIEFVADVAEAADNLVRQVQRQAPSEVGLEIFQGQLDHSINRRRYWPFPTIGRMHGFQLTSVTFSPNPSGPKDERATVILLRMTDGGQPLAVIWHYTCHPTAVIPDNVISADFPGAVRLALRQRFGEIPCLFVQGFCGNIRPNIAASPQRTSLRERIGRMIRIVAFGNLFPNLSAGDWTRWSRSLAGGVCGIAQGEPAMTFSPAQPSNRIGQHSAWRLLSRVRPRQETGGAGRRYRRRAGNRRGVGRTERGMGENSGSGRAGPVGADSSLRRISRRAVRLSSDRDAGSGRRL